MKQVYSICFLYVVYMFSKGAVARGHRIIFLWEEQISTPPFEIYLGHVTHINKVFLLMLSTIYTFNSILFVLRKFRSLSGLQMKKKSSQKHYLDTHKRLIQEQSFLQHPISYIFSLKTWIFLTSISTFQFYSPRPCFRATF